MTEASAVELASLRRSKPQMPVHLGHAQQGQALDCGASAVAARAHRSPKTRPRSRPASIVPAKWRSPPPSLPARRQCRNRSGRPPTSASDPRPRPGRRFSHTRGCSSEPFAPGRQRPLNSGCQTIAKLLRGRGVELMLRHKLLDLSFAGFDALLFPFVAATVQVIRDGFLDAVAPVWWLLLPIRLVPPR